MTHVKFLKLQIPHNTNHYDYNHIKKKETMRTESNNFLKTYFLNQRMSHLTFHMKKKCLHPSMTDAQPTYLCIAMFIIHLAYIKARSLFQEML